MHAADCKKLSKSPVGIFDSLSRGYAVHTLGGGHWLYLVGGHHTGGNDDLVDFRRGDVVEERGIFDSLSRGYAVHTLGGGHWLYLVGGHHTGGNDDLVDFRRGDVVEESLCSGAEASAEVM